MIEIAKEQEHKKSTYRKVNKLATVTQLRKMGLKIFVT